MGGGKVTRPNFQLPDPSEQDPLTEFYRLLQGALNHSGSFVLPGAYVRFMPPMDHNLYEEEIRDYCTFYSAPGPGRVEIFPPTRLRVLYHELSVGHEGMPMALMLTEESSRRVTAVQLLPPVADPDGPAQPLPSDTRALTLALTTEDLILADSAPALLGRQLAERTEQKSWLQHPLIDRWVMSALAKMQQVWRREHRPQQGYSR